MPYVQRNESGNIIGQYAVLQEGYAEEFLPDDSPELQPSIDAVAKQFEVAVQGELDADAQAKGYDGVLSACSYAGAPNAFQDDGLAYVARRSAAWVYCYQELAKVKSGERPMPTIEQIISELPPRVSA